MKFFASKITDKINNFYETGEVSFTNFLDPGEIVEARGILKNTPYVHFGGYLDAEREMIFVTADEDIDYEKYIAVIKITSLQVLNHRDVLGSLLGLGIKREMIGDILISDCAQVFLTKSVEEYVLANLKSIGRENVKVETCVLQDVIIPEKKVKRINVVVASLRIDAIVASVCGISREKSAEKIKCEDVKINHVITKSLSKTVCESDIISVRHFGRFTLSKIISTTRSGRIKIEVEKFE